MFANEKFAMNGCYPGAKNDTEMIAFFLSMNYDSSRVFILFSFLSRECFVFVRFVAYVFVRFCWCCGCCWCAPFHFRLAKGYKWSAGDSKFMMRKTWKKWQFSISFWQTLSGLFFFHTRRKSQNRFFVT